MRTLNCQVNLALSSLMVLGFATSESANAASLYSVTDLGTLPRDTFSGSWSFATDINDSGQVIGYSEYFRAFFWENGVMTDLGTLRGTQSQVQEGINGTQSQARGINDLGEVVGFADTNFVMNEYGHRYQQAFLWNKSQGMTDLGTLNGGSSSAAATINDSGQVVGCSVTGGYKSIEPFLWEEGAGMISLGTLGGNHSCAKDINNLGQIVGFSTKAANVQDTYAFIWEGGVMTDLNSLIPDDSGWRLTQAEGINNTGQIVGSGYINYQLHAFLLTPVSEPKPVPEPVSMWSLLAFGALGVGKVLKHKQKKHQ